MGDLDKWAMAFINVHRYGTVVIRTDPLALSDSISQAKLELRIGGVFDVQEFPMGTTEPLLPRTPRQVAEDLAVWNYDLSHLEELLEDPYPLTEQLLEQIKRERAELQRLDALWQQYADGIRQAVQDNPKPPEAEPTGDDAPEQQPE